MQVTNEQRDELISFQTRAAAIDAMFKRCINEQQIVEANIRTMLLQVREEHCIPADVDFTVCHVTGEITTYKINAEEAPVNG